MIVEFIGTPGAGKTTLLPTVMELLQEQGIKGRTVVEAARPYAQRTLTGRAVGRLAPASLHRPLLWQVFYRLSILFRLRFGMKHPKLVQQVVTSQRGRPKAARIGERRVLYWFFHTTGYYEFLTTYARSGEALLFDEGFIHRVVQLNASEAEEPQVAPIVAYVDLLPRPDLVIFVKASPEVCHERIYRRGIWEHFQGVSSSDVAQFVANAHWVVNQAVERTKANGWTVIEVDNGNQDVSAAQGELRGKFTKFVENWSKNGKI